MSPIFIAMIGVLLAILLLFVAFRLGAKAFKIMLVLLFICFAFMLIYMVVVINDVIEFKEGMLSGNTVFVLEDEGLMLANIVYVSDRGGVAAKTYNQLLSDSYNKNFNKEIVQDSTSDFRLIDEKNFVSDRIDFSNKDYESLLGNHFRLIMIDKDYFMEKGDWVVFLGEHTLTVKDIIWAIESEDPFETFALLVADLEEQPVEVIKENINPKIKESIKSYLFSILLTSFSDDLYSATQIFILSNQNKLRVYPETIMFTGIKELSAELLELIETREE